tara:strand:- start:1716 stop:2576 length:861 start_codon:yes stop_codon:yes gene_type:complete
MQLSTNLLGDVPSYFRAKLSGIYTEREADNMAFWALEELFGISRSAMPFHREDRLSESELVKLYKVVKRLQQQEPIQYIFEQAYFLELTLKVNQHVLIPRPETEELVDWIRKTYAKEQPLHFLDIATGSGCIALGLKYYFQQAKVSATDVDEKALAVARENAQFLNLEVDFNLIDALQMQVTPNLYDCIVSNPPYILSAEKETMEQNVLKHEPHLALFVEEDPLLFYRAIGIFASSALKPKGLLFFELHEDCAKDTELLMRDLGFEQVELKQDLQGKNRMLKAVNK